MTDYFDLAVIGLRILEKSMAKPNSRKSFSKKTQDLAVTRQKNRCNDCRNKSKVWDFDHIDGDSSNNSLDNCQALCPNCHAKKTRKKKQKKLKLSQIIRALKAFLKE